MSLYRSNYHNNNNNSQNGHSNYSNYTNNDNDNDDDDDDGIPLASRRKDLLRADLAPKKISHLQFGLLSPAEIQRVAEFQVCSRELFTMPARTPAHGGCLDPRLGVSDKLSTCATCHRKLVDCAGHYGYIRLALPVFHIGFLRHTLHILQCVCKTCSRVLLMEVDRQSFIKRMRHPRTDILAKGVTFKKVVDKCKKTRNCPYCGALNGTVKKITGAPTLKIVHDRFKGRHSDEEMESLLDSMDNAMRLNKDIAPILHKKESNNNPPFEDLLPTRVLELFSRITDDDCEVLLLYQFIR